MGTFIFIILILVVWAAILYNGLQGLAQKVRKQSSNVQVSISKKLSLINQLIDTVKNYQEGEQLVQLKVSQDNTAAAMINAYQQSGTTLASIQGMMERFPNLKANEQYQRLMKNIEDCENDIQKQRTSYNSDVEHYNTKRLRIPAIFISRALGFTEAPYMEFDMSGAKDVTTLKEFKTDDGERLTHLLNNAGMGIAKVTKNIAGQATQAGKAISNKIKEQSNVKYFYLIPGETPKGPFSLEEILRKNSEAVFPGESLICVVGSNNWTPISSLLIDDNQIQPYNQ